jgi:hypothetical protein
VKCDEARPICLRCIKFGIDCDGYEPQFQSRNHRSRGCTDRIPKSNSPNSQSFPLGFSPSLGLFENDRQHRYFTLFCSKTSAYLSGQFTSTLWQTVVLQACVDEQPLRLAVIAPGALISSSVVDADEAIDNTKSLRRQFALDEYSKAISQIRK